MATKRKPYDENAVAPMAYRIKSTGCEIVLTKIKKYMNGKALARDIWVFAYTNRQTNLANNYEDKPPFSTYSEEVDRNKNFGNWIPIK